MEAAMETKFSRMVNWLALAGCFLLVLAMEVPQ
jgi:hypothetical protein